VADKVGWPVNWCPTLIGLFSVQRRLEYGKYNFLIYLAHNEYAQYLPARLRSAEKIIMKA
jgi:hypothetical protein